MGSYIPTILPLLLLIASSTLTILGLIKNPDIFHSSWVPTSSLANLIIYITTFLVGSFFIISVLKRRNLKIFLMVLTIFIASTVGLNGFLVPLVLLFSSCLIGLGLFHLVGTEPKIGRLTIATLLGLSIYNLLIYALLHTTYNNYQTYSFLIISPIFLFYKQIEQVLAGLRSQFVNLESLSSSELLALVLCVLIGTIHFHQSLRPEYDYDALAAHLMIPHFIKTNGYWNFNVSQFVFGANQLAADIFYSINYVLSGESGTRFFNFLMFYLGVGLFFNTCRFVSGRFVSLLATLTLTSSPLMFTQTTSLHVEGVWCCFLLGVVVLTIQILNGYLSNKNIKLLYFVSIVGGTTLAIKLPTLFYLPFVGLYLVWCLWKLKFSNREKFYVLSVSFFLLLLFGVVPYLCCYYRTGNPVFPYFNGIFKSSFYYSGASFNNPIFNRPIEIRTIYDMTFHGSWYLESRNYPISLAYLIFSIPVAFFGLARVTDRKLSLIFILTFGSGIGIYLFQSYLRYLIPSLVLFLILLAAFLEHVRRLKSWTYEFSVVVLFSILPLAIIHIPDPTANYGGFNWSQAISRGSEFEHLVHRPQQKVFDYLNVRYGNRVSVLHLRDPLTAGLDATSLVPVWYNPELARRFTAIASNDDLKKLVLDYGITHIVISQSYPITPVVRTFLNRQTDIELDNGPITLHKVDFRSWAEANLLNTSAEQNGKTLSVRLKKSRNYLLEINLPIESQLTNDYWIVFDWRNEEDEQIEVKSILENVDQVSRNLEYYVVAPEGATTVELTLPLFQDSLQHGEYQSFIALGDDKSIPHFTGN